MNYLEFKEVLYEFPVFSTIEIEKQFPGFDNRRLVEWQEKGYIQKLRNRYYRFTDRKINEDYLFYCANAIYSPSYVSLESALSIYGFIPEGVFQITSCTSLKTNTFDTAVGVFSYRNIKSDFFFGYKLQQWEGHYYAIAEPEKAIIDFLYLNKIEDSYELESLRWNIPEIFNRISVEKLNTYAKHIGSKVLRTRINFLKDM